MIRLVAALVQWWTGHDPALKIGTPIPRFIGHDESKQRSAALRREHAERLRRESALIASGADVARRIHIVEKR